MKLEVYVWCRCVCEVYRCTAIHSVLVPLLCAIVDIIERTQISQSTCALLVRASAGLITCKKQGYEERNRIGVQVLVLIMRKVDSFDLAVAK